MRNSVCMDCPDRVADPNCHSTCEKYLKEKQVKDKIKKRKEKDNVVNDWYFNSLDKNNKH